MGPLMRDVDVVIANEEDVQSVLGVHVRGADVTGGALDAAGYRDAAEQVARDFGPPIVAGSRRRWGLPSRRARSSKRFQAISID